MSNQINIITNDGNTVVPVNGTTTVVEIITQGPQGPKGEPGSGGTGNIDTGSFATTGSNTFIGDQSITGSIYVQSGSYIPEPTYEINISSDNYTIPSPGIYYITVTPNPLYSIQFPNPNDYNGCSITICNQLPLSPTAAEISATNRPKQAGTSTDVSSIGAETMWIFKSFGGYWRGGGIN